MDLNSSFILVFRFQSSVFSSQPQIGDKLLE